MNELGIAVQPSHSDIIIQIDRCDVISYSNHFDDITKVSPLANKQTLGFRAEETG